MTGKCAGASFATRTSRSTFPLEPIVSPLPTALAAALAAPVLGMPAIEAFAVTLTGWFAAETGLSWLKGWHVSRYAPLAFLGRELLTFAAWLRAWTTNDVVWQNGRFNVFVGARAPRAQKLALQPETFRAGTHLTRPVSFSRTYQYQFFFRIPLQPWCVSDEAAGGMWRVPKTASQYGALTP